jgi:uncharacterized protein
LQSFDTGSKCRRVSHNRVFRRLAHIDKQVTAKQITVGGQNPDRAWRMPRQMQNFRSESAVRKIIPFFQVSIWSKSFDAT